MSDLVLSVRLTGDGKGLVEVVGKGSDALDEFGRETKQAETSLKQLDRQSAVVDGKMRNLAGSIHLVGGALAAFGVINEGHNIIATSAEFERLQTTLTSAVGSIEGGAAAFDAVQNLAAETAFQVQDLTDGFIKLKTFGLDPLDGSYQSIIDQSAKLGGSQDTLSGIILAVGQAWAKQKLQGEEILQLIERGVPVWELLQNVTGLNVTELQKLSEQGKLTRDVIKLLLDEMGRTAAGAAIAQVDTLSGSISNFADVSDRARVILGDSSGLNATLKSTAQDVTALVNAMIETGQLASIGGFIGQSFLVLTASVTGLSSAIAVKLVTSTAAAVASEIRLAQTSTGLSAALGVQTRRTLAQAAANVVMTRSTSVLGRGMALLGGPAGLAIGVATALGVWAAASRSTAQATDQLNKSNAELAENSGQLSRLGIAQQIAAAQDFLQVLRDAQIQAAADGNASISANLQDRIARQQARIDGLKNQLNDLGANEARINAILGGLGNGDRAKAGLDGVAQSLNSQRLAIGLTENQLILYNAAVAISTAENQALAPQVWSAAQALAAQAKATKDADAAQAAYHVRLSAAEKVVLSTRTAAEEYSDVITRLVAQLNIGDISPEVFSRAAVDEQERTGIGSGGDDREALRQQFDVLSESLLNEEAQIELSYQRRANVVLDALQAEAATQQEARSAMLALENEYQQEILTVRQQAAQANLSVTSDLFGGLAALAQQGGERSFGVWKALARAQTVVSTYSAAQKAFESQIIPGDPTSLVRAYAAAGGAVASGLARLVQINKTSLSTATAGGGAAGGAAPVFQANPVTGQPASTQQAGGGATQVIIQGPIYGFEDFEAQVTDAVQNAVNNRDVVIISSTSRQAAELTA